MRPKYTRELICRRCHLPYAGHFNSHFCETCRPIAEQERRAQWLAAHQDTNRAAKARYRAKPSTQVAKARDHSEKHFGGLRDAVLERDNYRCTQCGKPWHEKPKAICVHHRDEDKSNNTMENLITLCRACHARVHARPPTPREIEMRREAKRRYWAKLSPEERQALCRRLSEAQKKRQTRG